MIQMERRQQLGIRGADRALRHRPPTHARARYCSESRFIATPCSDAAVGPHLVAVANQVVHAIAVGSGQHKALRIAARIKFLHRRRPLRLSRCQETARERSSPTRHPASTIRGCAGTTRGRFFRATGKLGPALSWMPPRDWVRATIPISTRSRNRGTSVATAKTRISRLRRRFMVLDRLAERTPIPATSDPAAAATDG